MSSWHEQGSAVGSMQHHVSIHTVVGFLLALM